MGTMDPILKEVTVTGIETYMGSQAGSEQKAVMSPSTGGKVGSCAFGSKGQPRARAVEERGVCLNSPRSREASGVCPLASSC